MGTAPPLLFAAVYDAWFDSVHRWASVLGGPREDLEDLVQEVFVVVDRRLPSFDGRNLAGWLYRITERQVKDARRRAWFKNIYRRPREVELERFESNQGTPEDLLRGQEDRVRFYRLVAKMNSTWRETFVLAEVEGYSGEEIAALRCIGAATVRTHLHRARKQFLALLAKEVRS